MKVSQNLSSSKKVVATNTSNGVEICFYSINKACQFFKIHHQYIDFCLKGQIKVYKGYSFKYAIYS